VSIFRNLSGSYDFAQPASTQQLRAARAMHPQLPSVYW